VAWTADGGGHWLATRDGGVYTFGNAEFYGSAGDRPLTSPITGIASTRTGKGYWLVAADGGVFAFGDATFHGSAAGTRMRGVVVGIAPTRSERGYWLASADGGVFTFGDAKFRGGATDQPLNEPIVGITATRTGKGYWLASAEGGVFTFGDAKFRGGLSGETLNSPIVGMAVTRDGKGYWLAAADGGVFAFGDAPFLGSSGGGVWGKVVGIAGGAARTKAAPGFAASGSHAQLLSNRIGSACTSQVWPPLNDLCPSHHDGATPSFGAPATHTGRPSWAFPVIFRHMRPVEYTPARIPAFCSVSTAARITSVLRSSAGSQWFSTSTSSHHIGASMWARWATSSAYRIPFAEWL
jgi:hypothetical protein